MREPSGFRLSLETQRDFEMMTRSAGDTQDMLATHIKRQLGSEATKRFLRALPAFRTEHELPDRFKDLLDRLDGVDYATGGRRTQ
jgi:hypothetical protein